MKEFEKSRFVFSRRKFLGTTATAAAALSVGALSTRCTSASPPRATGTGIPNSKFGGIQIGAITYSFRSLEPGIENVLKACVEAGVSSIELMSNGIEDWCGAPAVVRAPRRPGASSIVAPPDGMRGGQQQQTYTDEEYAEFERQTVESQEALRQWRLNAPMDKFTELAQLFRNAGVNIHIVKWQPSRWAEDEIDYAFTATQAMGAQGITEEIGDDAARILGPIAERHGLKAIFHNHMQYEDPAFSADPFLAYSPANMLNFDIGHYFGSTGLHPNDFIEKYADRIFSIHLKDKTGKNTDPANQNQVWGQGETPLDEVLLFIKQKKYPIHCDIELEYPIAPWSNSVKEVRTCVNYARQILI